MVNETADAELPAAQLPKSPLWQLARNSRTPFSLRTEELSEAMCLHPVFWEAGTLGLNYSHCTPITAAACSKSGHSSAL